ncbi:hypothetical protein [Paraburkholderia aromaticivorans]|uniref:hypothetical protein n=1 Tax=Paraburkholderia aromaticivorans TaxID=2026199 RepID=UPI001455FB47|nr:hypothetical protein [Paraburkholderia aromaticivorans]
MTTPRTDTACAAKRDDAAIKQPLDVFDTKQWAEPLAFGFDCCRIQIVSKYRRNCHGANDKVVEVSVGSGAGHGGCRY